MKIVLISRVLMLSVVLLMGCTNAMAGRAKGAFEQSLAVEGPIQLDIRTGSGSITVRNGPADQVEVVGTIVAGKGLWGRGTKEAEEIVRQIEAQPPVQYSNGRLRVGHIENRAHRNDVSVSYEITVPFETQVKSHTGSGSQDLIGISGPAEASTGSGDLLLTDIGGAVEASTGSGDLELTDIGGAVEARTGSGSIHAEGIGGDFKAKTGSGSVRLTQNAPGDVVATSGSGSIVLRGIDGALRADAGSGSIKVEGRQAGRWELDTGSGSIRIHLPEDASFELDAESNSGNIDINHPITVQEKISDDHLKGQVRGGGPLLNVRSGSGNIRIR
jgi:DUF4097 and DUF4098 domain-containing protein YvlB